MWAIKGEDKWGRESIEWSGQGGRRGCRLAIDNTVRGRTWLFLPAIVILRRDCKSYSSLVLARICRMLQWE